MDKRTSGPLRSGKRSKTVRVPIAPGQPGSGNKADLKECHRIIKELMENPRARWFLHPVDITRVPDYYEIIQHPMDLGTIKVSVNWGSVCVIGPG